MLYHHKSSREASPKAISGRTSYLPVRLEFHPYPQLIHPFFNRGWFGPPLGLTPASTWPWVDHPASGLERATNRPFRLAFATDPPHGLTSRHATNSQAHSSIGTPSPLKALTACKRPVSGTISLPSRGTFHHSLTVLSTIGHTEYLGLPGGPGRFTTDSTSPLLLGNPTTPTSSSSATGLSPTPVDHSKPLHLTTMQKRACHW